MSTSYCDDYTYERAHGHLPPRETDTEPAADPETKVVWPDSPDVETK